ncbi:MAG: hypothetical protein KF784_02345 [Fimbriimonadaceae bacterium]|nr:hypothetical protein [Fimbriimonadaceae bacterium]
MTLLLERYSRAEILEASLALMFEASLLDCPIVTRVTAGGLLTMLINERVVSGNDRPMKTPQYKEIVDLILAGSFSDQDDPKDNRIMETNDEL